MSVFAHPRFHDEDAAREWLEQVYWPNGPICPKCGEVGRAYKQVDTETHKGRYRCASPECRKDFTVTTGTVLKSSHIPLRKWVLAFHLMSSSKKGVSAHQLHRTLEITYRTAWFLAHRLREAMNVGAGATPMGGEGRIVEADETYYGPVEERRQSKQRGDRPYTKGGRSGVGGKRAIVALVERGGGVRTFHVAFADKATVAGIVSDNVARESRLHTDESKLYTKVGAGFAAHETVTHSAKEYVRGDVHTNSAEGYFSIFKRGMRGVYQHCREKHLHRYLAEYDFRYNHRVALGFDDLARAVAMVRAAEGKRLTYRQPHVA
jgi:transposase-like protein